MNFSDLKFKKENWRNGPRASLRFQSGLELSVVTGEFVNSSFDDNKFEIGIIDSLGLLVRHIPHLTKEEVDAIIKVMEFIQTAEEVTDFSFEKDDIVRKLRQHKLERCLE